MTNEEKLRKLAEWLKGWFLVESEGTNVALQVAIDQLFDPEENGPVLEVLGVSASPQPRCPKCYGRVVLRRLFDKPAAFCAVQCPTCIPTDGFWLIRMAEDMSQFFAAAPAQEPQTSRTYGDLPGSIRSMVEAHEWDNKNISEQRDYALDMVDFLERELNNFRRNRAAAQEQPVENSPQEAK